MKELRIEWETGYMVLDVHAFSPTTEKKSRKIAKFINKNCSKASVGELIGELRCMAEYLRLGAEECRALVSLGTTQKDKELQAKLAKLARMAEARRKRLIRDINNIEEELNGKI